MLNYIKDYQEGVILGFYKHVLGIKEEAKNNVAGDRTMQMSISNDIKKGRAFTVQEIQKIHGLHSGNPDYKNECDIKEKNKEPF